ncbi:unnamed protein product [Adineta ricciae]|uniref:Uncharacterized protein n=1 Tax=Adineta ricciae TaxID=249248 RepID=A0A815IZJ4_ADIRI|nr:unnamed protein product [Adineta ricciae]
MPVDPSNVLEFLLYALSIHKLKQSKIFRIHSLYDRRSLLPWRRNTNSNQPSNGRSLPQLDRDTLLEDSAVIRYSGNDRL